MKHARGKLKSVYGLLAAFLVVGLAVATRAYGTHRTLFQQSKEYDKITGSTGILSILCAITDTIFVILILISIIMVLWSAYIYLTSGGSEEKIKKATQTITFAVVGIIIALLAKGVPFIVSSMLDNTLSNSACGGPSASAPPATPGEWYPPPGSIPL